MVILHESKKVTLQRAGKFNGLRIRAGAQWTREPRFIPFQPGDASLQAACRRGPPESRLILSIDEKAQ